MDYERLLNGYVFLPINEKKHLIYLLKNGTKQNYITKLNTNLYNLYKSLGFNINFMNIIGKIRITKDGLYFDLTNLKNMLSEYFNIELDENLPENLDKLEQDIKNKKYTILNITPSMKKEFSKYKLQRYINPNAKESTINKARRKEFMNKTIKDIRLFKDLYLNEAKYSKVNDIFDQNKVNLYLAFIIMEHAIRCKKNNDTKKYGYALKYLNDYIKNNQDLIKEDFSIYLQKNSANKRTYKIIEIENFVRKNLMKNENTKSETQQEDTEKFNYSFFECDEIKGREILGKYFRYSQKIDNSEELKILLARKMKLYESLNYVKIKIGIDSFNGYIGFQLNNGFIVLDKLYENLNEGKIATDNAIYIVKEKDFEMITKMSKTQAIEAINLGLINAKRIFHSGEYEERVKKYIK